MKDNMCEKCKFREVSAFSRPCVTCKYTFDRGTCQFYTCESFFEPANAEDAERGEIDHPAHYAGEIECIDALLETMGRDDVRAFCLCTLLSTCGDARRSTRRPKRTWRKRCGTCKSTSNWVAIYEAGLLGELAAPGQPQKGPF